MDINRIAEDFSAAPQITPDDVAEAARAGFRTIICNRPDDEVPDQPQAADVAAAAKAAGLEFRHIPFSGGNLTPETVAAFEAALADCPGPVLAYCRSGTRSTMCWGLAMAASEDPDTLIAAAARGGYDLAPLRPAMAARREGA